MGIPNYQYEPLTPPSSWTADEKRLLQRITDIFDDIYMKWGRLDSNHLAPSAVKEKNIAPNAVTDSKIVGLTASKITAGTIDAAEIEVVNLKAANITVGTINGQQISPGAIGTGHLAQGAVTGSKIDFGAVAANKLNLTTHMIF